MNSFNKNVLIAGFAMFAMFFGSGNLVFPIVVGSLASDNYFWATIGLLITSILMPFMGLLGVSLFNGDRREYFAALGKKPALFITLVILGLMGPIGVAPRCIIVAYDGFSHLVDSMNFMPFSAAFSLLVIFIIYKRRRFMDIMGAVLTPVLLLSIVVIIIAGVFFVEQDFAVSDLDSLGAFNMGISKGYLTMDLLATVFFGATAIQYIKASLEGPVSSKLVFKQSLVACFIGAGLLSLIYVGFVYLGAKFMPQLEGVEPGKMLIVVAYQVLGDMAVPFVSITFVLACLTTASTLVSLFADFLYQDLFSNYLSRNASIIITSLITFAVSLFGFDKLASWLGLVVTIVYPALIGLAAANILNKLYNFNRVSQVFYLVLGISVAYRFFA